MFLYTCITSLYSTRDKHSLNFITLELVLWSGWTLSGNSTYSAIHQIKKYFSDSLFEKRAVADLRFSFITWSMERFCIFNFPVPFMVYNPQFFENIHAQKWYYLVSKLWKMWHILLTWYTWSYNCDLAYFYPPCPIWLSNSLVNG